MINETWYKVSVIFGSFEIGFIVTWGHERSQK